MACFLVKEKGKIYLYLYLLLQFVSVYSVTQKFVRILLKTYPVGTLALILRVRRPEHATGHSPPSNAEIENAWSYTS